MIENLIIITCFVIAIVLFLLGLEPKTELDNPKQRHGIIKNNDRYLFLSIAILFTIYAYKTADNLSLWLDELAQISYYKDMNLAKVLKEWVFGTSNTLAVWNFLSFVWYRLVPYGQQFLLLLPTVLTGIAIYFIGLSGKLFANKRVGIFVMLLMATSALVVTNVAHEYRQYAVYLLFSIMTFYLWQKRNIYKNSERWRDIFAFGFLLSLLPYTHTVAILICAAFALYDLFLCILKKIRFRCIISYLMLLVVYILPFLRTFFAQKAFFTGFSVAPEKLTYGDIGEMFQFLLENNILIILLTCVGTAIALTLLIKFKLGFFEKYSELGFFLWVIFFTVGVAFIYSVFINPAGSFFVERYFIGLLPYLFLICAYSLDKLCNYVNYNDNCKAINWNITRILCIFLVIYLGGISVIHVTNEKDFLRDRDQYGGTVSNYPTYREAADWLQNQDDIHSSDSAVVITTYHSTKKGWMEYYVTEKGRRKPFVALSQFVDKEFNRIEDYKNVYLYEVGYLASEKTAELFEENYVLVDENTDLKIKHYSRKD